MRYFTTQGRLSRLAYYLQIIPSVLIGAVSAYMSSIGDPNWFPVSLAAISIAFFPSVRRIHDIGYSGWWFILSIVPVVNFALGIVLLLMKGTDGKNRYGPDPLQSEETVAPNESANWETEKRRLPSEVERKVQRSEKRKFDPDDHEKKCPMCAEYIKLEARLCKHCGHEFSEEEVERQIEERKKEVEREKRKEEGKSARREPNKGAEKRRICPTCQTPHPLDQKECSRCGTDLTS